MLQVVGEDDRRRPPHYAGRAVDPHDAGPLSGMDAHANNDDEFPPSRGREEEPDESRTVPSIPFIPVRWGRRPPSPAPPDWSHNCTRISTTVRGDGKTIARGCPVTVSRPAASTSVSLSTAAVASEVDANSVSELPSFELLWHESGQKRILDPGPPYFGAFERRLFDPQKMLWYDLDFLKWEVPSVVKNLWQGQFYPKVEWTKKTVDVGLKYVPVVYKEWQHMYGTVYDRMFSTYRLYGERITSTPAEKGR